MSLKLNERYPGRFNNPSAEYPQGSFKNRTTPTAKDGSYIEKDWANDWQGFFSSMLSSAAIVPNGLVDRVGSSQYFSALQSVISSNIPAFGTAATKDAQVVVSDFSIARLALVGSGGIGGGTIGYASSVDDLTAGQFFSTGPAVTGLPSWAATAQGQGHYIHLNSSFGYMRWTEITTGISYERAKVSGVWQAWGECYGQVNCDLTGAIMTFPTNAAPAGFLKANGAAISRTVYARLFAKIGTTYGAGDGSTTFNVPELRGEFIRGFSDGRASVDVDRVIGSYQLGSLVSYDPTAVSAVVTGLHSNGADANTRTDLGVDIPESTAAYPNADVISATGAATFGIAAAAGVSRPRNVALLFCIKY